MKTPLVFDRTLVDGGSVWVNDEYIVIQRDHDTGLTHLSFKNRANNPFIDWRDRQEIKNQLCGPEREGCELYPAESRLVDAANQFHLWVLPEGDRFPFGFEQRFIVDNEGIHEQIGANQRKFDKTVV